MDESWSTGEYIDPEHLEAVEQFLKSGLPLDFDQEEYQRLRNLYGLHEDYDEEQSGLEAGSPQDPGPDLVNSNSVLWAHQNTSSNAGPSQSSSRIWRNSSTSREPRPPPDQIATDSIMGNTGPEWSAYIDDGPQKPEEDEGMYMRRVIRATRNMGIERRRVPNPGNRSEQEGEEAEEEEEEWRYQNLGSLSEDWVSHRTKIRVGDEGYDLVYHQEFLQKKLMRQQRNKERREKALRSRRALESECDLERVPTPEPALDSGDELYTWDIANPLPTGYHPQNELTKILIRRGVLSPDEAEDEDDQARDKGKGKVVVNQPAEGQYGGFPVDPTPFSAAINDDGHERDYGLNNPFGNAPTGFGPNATYGTLPERSNPLAYDRLAPRPPAINQDGSMVSPNHALPHVTGISSGPIQNNAIPSGAPTQSRVGMPDRSPFLPDGYAWSDFRCNNCARLKIACHAFPAKVEADIGKRLVKDLSQTLISFPCPQCQENPALATTCTWSIMKFKKTLQLYWNGATAIPDPGAAQRPPPRNKHEKYKYYEAFDHLEPPPWGPGMPPSNQSGSSSIPGASSSELHSSRGTKTGPANTSSGRIAKLVTRSIVKRTHRPVKPPSKYCTNCESVGTRVRNACNISQRHPCSRCDQRGEECNEFFAEAEDSDVDDDSDKNDFPTLKGGRIQSSRASKPTPTRSARPTSSTPSIRKGEDRKEKSGKGEIQKSKSRALTSPQKRTRGNQGSPPSKLSKRMYTAIISADSSPNCSLGELALTEDEQAVLADDAADHGACDFCSRNDLSCDGRRPCGNCSVWSSTPCETAPSQPYQALLNTVLDQRTTQTAHENLSTTGLSAAQHLIQQFAQEEGLLVPTNEQFAPQPGFLDSLPQKSPETQRMPPQDDQFELDDEIFRLISQELQPFSPIRGQNAAQEQRQAAFEPAVRAMNALQANFNIEGVPPLPPAPYFTPHPINVLTNADDHRLPGDNGPPHGAVLPDIMFPPDRNYTNETSCEDTDGCHEFDPNAFLQNIQARCNGRPTKPCSVFGHTEFCACVNCRATQDHFVNATPPGIKSQLQVVEDAKAYYCKLCAEFAKYENSHGGNTRIGECLCSGQMSKAWLCNGHRSQAIDLVKRRTLLMKEWVTRMRKTDGPLPCARCQEAEADRESGAWECAACREKVVVINVS